MLATFQDCAWSRDHNNQRELYNSWPWTSKMAVAVMGVGSGHFRPFPLVPLLLWITDIRHHKAGLMGCPLTIATNASGIPPAEMARNTLLPWLPPPRSLPAEIIDNWNSHHMFGPVGWSFQTISAGTMATAACISLDRPCDNWSRGIWSEVAMMERARCTLLQFRPAWITVTWISHHGPGFPTHKSLCLTHNGHHTSLCVWETDMSVVRKMPGKASLIVLFFKIIFSFTGVADHLKEWFILNFFVGK